jgi:hypothetical protein
MAGHRIVVRATRPDVVCKISAHAMLSDCSRLIGSRAFPTDRRSRLEPMFGAGVEADIVDGASAGNCAHRIHKLSQAAAMGGIAGPYFTNEDDSATSLSGDRGRCVRHYLNHELAVGHDAQRFSLPSHQHHIADPQTSGH